MVQAKVIEGAEAFELGEGPVAALLVHGFQGSPQGMRGLGEYLSERGIAVAAPRLPGHGTTWQDLNTRKSQEWIGEATTAFEKLAAGHDEVFLVGLSFGAALSIDIAANFPDRVRGLVSLAGFVYSDDPLRHFAPLLVKLVKSLPPKNNDIADPEASEIATTRFPAQAGFEAYRFASKIARGSLPRVTCPALIIHGRQDHTVPLRSSQIIHDEIGSATKELVVLERSYHVITLDYEKEDVYRRTYDFIKGHSAHAL